MDQLILVLHWMEVGKGAGKAVDVSIMFIFWRCSNKETHAQTCTANYKGTRGM